MSSVYRSFDNNLFLSSNESTVFGVIHRGQCAYLCHKQFFGVTVEQIFQCLIETKNDIEHSAEIRMKLCNLERFLAQRPEGDDSLPVHLYMCNEMAKIIARIKCVSIVYFLECDEIGHIGYQAVDLYSPKNAIAGHILPILVRGGDNDYHDLVTARPRCEEIFQRTLTRIVDYLLTCSRNMTKDFSVSFAICCCVRSMY